MTEVSQCQNFSCKNVFCTVVFNFSNRVKRIVKFYTIYYYYLGL